MPRVVGCGRPHLAVALALLALLLIGACNGQGAEHLEIVDSSASITATVPDSELSAAAIAGKQRFAATCAVCHGPDAGGTNLGPPLIDRIYHPGHHPDFSIRNAVNLGVRQHHWTFGDMPPVSGVSLQDVEAIICFVREAQLANGIFLESEYQLAC